MLVLNVKENREGKRRLKQKQNNLKTNTWKWIVSMCLWL